jgi:hypothetical protein
MAGNTLQRAGGRTSPPHPPVRVWRDRVLVAVVVLWSAVEATSARMWRGALSRSPSFSSSRSPCCGDAPILWPRYRSGSERWRWSTSPGSSQPSTTDCCGASRLRSCCLTRCSAGEPAWEAGIGLGVLLTWPAVTSVADPTGAAQVVGAFGFFLFSAAPVPVGLDSSASGWGSSSRRGGSAATAAGHPKFPAPALRPARCTARHPVRGRSVPPRDTRRFVTLWGVAANGGGSLRGVRCGRSREPTWRPRRGFGRRAFA